MKISVIDSPSHAKMILSSEPSIGSSRLSTLLKRHLVSISLIDAILQTVRRNGSSSVARVSTAQACPPRLRRTTSKNLCYYPANFIEWKCRYVFVPVPASLPDRMKQWPLCETFACPYNIHICMPPRVYYVFF